MCHPVPVIFLTSLAPGAATIRNTEEAFDVSCIPQCLEYEHSPASFEGVIIFTARNLVTAMSYNIFPTLPTPRRFGRATSQPHHIGNRTDHGISTTSHVQLPMDMPHSYITDSYHRRQRHWSAYWK
ncbi:hypothetical protein SNOG_13724 [Parastagonospora nodorum SN15]|uniref:Uncharacterized protein n=1 Tax=Phaeosphaeria nodorum (strain SN15 / ATCC MYA-4574 / FGSC 10173) TaxID=321614 RepID=Q0U3E0_PHANO|nr:hypothetical protein SNOG_13724 [Parastagonospora nodorum SN15]EAT78748.1 hypothetical protein SNOG_13724 [Parastagonospora nodorum SN15]